MGKPWLKALFADLAPKADSDSGFSPGSFEESRSAKWSKQPITSSPPASEDYDLAAHARASLHLNGSPTSRAGKQRPPWAPHHLPNASSHARVPNAGWREDYASSRALPHGYARISSGGSPSRDAGTPPPSGPRPVLFPQEVPSQAVDHISSSRRPANGTGGFVDPQVAFLRHQRETSPSQRASHTPPSSPRRSNAFASSSDYAPQAREHISSNPIRPVFLSTPPPSLPYRPYSDPQPTGHAPKAPAISRSSSDESTKGKPNQCHGTTGAGKRCTRIVKSKTIPPKVAENASVTEFRMGHNALKQLDRRLSMRKKPHGPSKRNINRKQRIIEIESDSDSELDDTSARLSPVKGVSSMEEDDLEELPVFCFQHLKQTLEQRGTFINSKSVDFQDWIPAYLPQETQLQLRHEMVKPRAEERRGYIYVHEFPFSSGNSETTTFMKLGRSVRPVARLSEWKSQCKSRQPIVRDIFPLHPSHPLHPGHTADSLITTHRASPSHQHGRLLFSEQGANHHQRWERLCLIELAGIAAIQGRDRRDEGMARQACIDCGKIHIELFLVNKGSYEKDIREMVLRWQRFVETVL